MQKSDHAVVKGANIEAAIFLIQLLKIKLFKACLKQRAIYKSSLHEEPYNIKAEHKIVLATIREMKAQFINLSLHNDREFIKIAFFAGILSLKNFRNLDKILEIRNSLVHDPLSSKDAKTLIKKINSIIKYLDRYLFKCWY